MKNTIAATLIVISSPTSAMPLWQDVNAAMTVDQVHDLYPQQRAGVRWRSGSTQVKGVLRVGSCEPTVIIHHPRGIVEQVSTGMVALGLHKTCTDEAYKAMLAKYGSPVGQVEIEKASPAGFDYKNAVSTWIVSDVIVIMDRDTGYHDDRWSVIYAPVKATTGL